MTATRLKRKDRKNIARQVNKTRVIKQLLARPVIKNVDVEELKAKYGSGSAVSANVTETGYTPAEAVTRPVEPVQHDARLEQADQSEATDDTQVFSPKGAAEE